MSLQPGLDTERSATAAGLRAPAIVGAVGLSAAVLLHFHDPHDSGSYGYCPFLALTGIPCPGCGGLRAVNDLTRGDLVGAASSNILAVALVAALAVAWVLWVVRRWRGSRERMFVINTRVGYAAIALLVVFGILRNTPWGSWLAP
ncbi:DUF2752 domain-containing protein [Aeromicrobium sp.]|uniref:DUF2752 domain-containing protein n=1 Tax=Aeromicrobium sp. TaxID=1871063 RepID=UPI0030C51C6C